MRQALGAPQFDLVGVSYGTRMAQQYLMRHPDGVRSVVLDSVAPNELVFGEDFAQNLENALKAQFALCTKNPACSQGVRRSVCEPDQAARRAARASRRIMLSAIRSPSSRRRCASTEQRLAGLVRMFAYSPETAALLPLSIAEGLKGDFTPLAGQTQAAAPATCPASDEQRHAGLGDLRRGRRPACADDPQDEARRCSARRWSMRSRAMCAVWPHGTRPADFHAPLKSDKPVFVLAGELDPVTPPRYGEQVHEGPERTRSCSSPKARATT